MAIRTTNIELKGDRFQARNLALAHADRMVEEFRNSINFQKLDINSTTRNFFTKAGIFVGSIYIQSIHGTENIIVNVPPDIKEPKKKEILVQKDIVYLPVPVIRSIDNDHWIACLSGKFDGPYYHFPNTFNLDADIFYSFSQEREYHNKVISIGASSLNGSISPPELLLISPTGETPDEDGNHPEEYTWVDNDSFSRQYQYTGELIWLCDAINLGGYRDDYTGSSTSHQNESLHVFDQKFDDLLFDLTTNVTLSRAWVFCSVSSEPGPTTEQDVKDACSGRDYLQIDEDEFFSDNPPAGFEYEDSYESTIGESDIPWASNYSVRAERSNNSNSVSCYRTSTTNTTTAKNLPFDPCDPDNTVQTSTNTVQTYCDYILVDNNEFLLRDKTESSFPRFFQRDMKYYNTDRSVATTALIASNKGNIGTNYERWLYYYVGPNSEGELHTTEFFPDSGTIYHIIPNVAGIDDTVFFGGRIFLGLIKYEVERQIEY